MEFREFKEFKEFSNFPKLPNLFIKIKMVVGNFYSHFLNLKYQNVRPETKSISAIAHK